MSMHKPSKAVQPEFILFYDGQCPICQKEVAWLRWKNKHGKLGLQDINAEDFEPAHYHKTHDEMMAEIHGAYPDGTIIKGLEVFSAAYSAVGLGWLMAPTQWPLLKPMFAKFYALFARNRLRWGRLLSKKACANGKCGV